MSPSASPSSLWCARHTIGTSRSKGHVRAGDVARIRVRDDASVPEGIVLDHRVDTAL